MKNIFSVRKQKGFNQTDIEGHVFLDRTVDATLSDQLDQTIGDAFELEKQKGLKLYWTVIKYISLSLGIIILVGILRADVSLVTAYENAPYLFYIGPIALVIGLSILLAEQMKKRKVEHSDTYQDTSSLLEAQVASARIDLDIPENSMKLDVFQYTYKLSSGGKEKINTAPFFQYLLIELSFFSDDNYLYFADAYMVGKIEKSSFRSITPIKKTALVSGWHKEIWIDKAPYKDYKIRINQFDTLMMKPFYQLDIKDPLGDFAILFPPYELEHFEQLTGLKVTV